MKNGLIIDKKGTKRYYLNDKFHRVDGPAIEYTNGDKFWYLNDEQHRDDGPAQEYVNGGKFWYLHGKEHRVGGPAEEWLDGDKFWFLNGKQLNHPKEFETMEEWFQYLSDNDDYSLQWINDINGLFGFIKNPTSKQTRLNAMRWKI